MGEDRSRREAAAGTDAAVTPGHDPTAPAPDRRRRPATGWRNLVAAGLLAIALAVAAAIGLVMLQDARSDDPPPRRREDRATDLLAWIPATGETRRTFTVWPGETAGGDGTPTATMSFRAVQELGISPLPRTLGLTRGWDDAFGWTASDVTSWATAGNEQSRIAILDGDFSLDAIRMALANTGYRESNYRGARLFVGDETAPPVTVVGGDAPAAANAIAVLDGRLITAADPARARSAIDAATGRAQALGDDAAVSMLLETLTPTVLLTATDAADQAASCQSRAADHARDSSGRYVAMAYGTVGVGGPPRTLVAVTFARGEQAEAASDAFALGWQDTTVAAGAAVAPLTRYGTVSNVSRTGAVLVAELVDGRVAGWAPAAVRFAEPVCAAVADAFIPPPSPATPVLTASNRRGSALAALPDHGELGTTTFIDLSAVGQARGQSAPSGPSPDPAQVAAWLSALDPLPTTTVLPVDPAMLARWPATFGIALDAVDLVAESRTGDPSETVAIVIGRWDPSSVATALTAAGYDWTEREGVLQFAVSPSAKDDPNHPAHLAGGSTWDNIALLGNRLVLSTATSTLRAAIPIAKANPSATPADDNPTHGHLLETAPDATAGVITGRESTRRICADRGLTGQTPTWLAVAILWVATDSGDRGIVAVAPAPDTETGDLARDLTDQITRARLPPPAGAPITAVPAGSQAFGVTFGFVGAEVVTLGSDTIAVARFSVPPATAETERFFTATDAGCPFVI